MDVASVKSDALKDATKLLVDGIILSTRICPDCGSRMREVERVTESGATFIWYECENANCEGQWLQKYESQMGIAV